MGAPFLAGTAGLAANRDLEKLDVKLLTAFNYKYTIQYMYVRQIKGIVLRERFN